MTRIYDSAVGTECEGKIKWWHIEVQNIKKVDKKWWKFTGNVPACLIKLELKGKNDNNSDVLNGRWRNDSPKGEGCKALRFGDLCSQIPIALKENSSSFITEEEWMISSTVSHLVQQKDYDVTVSISSGDNDVFTREFELLNSCLEFEFREKDR